MTIECALVLPLFFFGMTSMISLMDLYRTEIVHLAELCQNAKAAATYTYNPVGDGLTELVLPDIYSFTPVGGMIPVRKIWRSNLVRVRSWNGKEHVLHSAGNMQERMVYVTESGTVYHRSISCRYLSVRMTSITSAQLAVKRNHYGQRYGPCETCVGNGEPAGIVYITEKGSKYHNQSGCPSLKRTVRMVKESETGLRPCSVCGSQP